MLFVPRALRAAWAAPLLLAGLPSSAFSADLDREARALLQNQCADCHFSGERNGKKGKRPLLDGSLSREQLANELGSDKSTPIVKLGGPEESALYQAVTLPDDDDDRMPKSTGKDPRRALTAAEKELLARWIRGEPGPAAAEPRRFVREIDVLRAVQADLRAHAAEAKDLRYLTLHQLWNLGPAAEPTAGFATYRAAVAKLLNSLSWRPGIAVPAAIDPDGLILRVRLSDYGWAPGGAWDEWREISRRYPYAFGVDQKDPEFVQVLSEILLRTGGIERTPEPQVASSVLRADWFVFACAQPPLYDELLYRRVAPAVLDGRVPADHALETALGVDVLARLRETRTAGASLADELDGHSPTASAALPVVLRAGFNPSGVSRANRLVERHAIDAERGYWKSYDFNEARRLDEGNLVLRPLGPPGAGLSQRHEFLHDGGEMIFSLPNGLQGYLLTTAAGGRLAVAPADIVEDRTTFRAGRPILNGLSCLVCHDAGMKRPPALDARGLPKEIVLGGVDRSQLSEPELRALRSLYVTPDVVARAFERDAARFAAALRALGAEGLQPEPVGFLYNRFLRPLDAAQVLVELDREPTAERQARLPDLMARSASSVVSSKAVLLRSGAGVARAEFLELFTQMIEELANKRVLRFVPTEFAEFGGKNPPPPPPPPPPPAKTESGEELRRDLLRLLDEAERGRK